MESHQLLQKNERKAQGHRSPQTRTNSDNPVGYLVLRSQLHLHLVYFFLFRLGRNHRTRSPFPAYIGTLYGQPGFAGRTVWHASGEKTEAVEGMCWFFIPCWFILLNGTRCCLLPTIAWEFHLANSSLLKDVVTLGMPLIPTFLSFQ